MTRTTRLLRWLRNPRAWLLALTTAGALGLGISPDARTLIVTLGPQLAELLSADPVADEPR